MIFFGWIYGLFFFLYSKVVLFGKMSWFFFFNEVRLGMLLIVIFVLSYFGKMFGIFIFKVILLYFFIEIIEICFWLKILVFFENIGFLVFVFLVRLKCKLLGMLL